MRECCLCGREDCTCVSDIESIRYLNDPAIEFAGDPDCLRCGNTGYVIMSDGSASCDCGR